MKGAKIIEGVFINWTFFYLQLKHFIIFKIEGEEVIF